MLYLNHISWANWGVMPGNEQTTDIDAESGDCTSIDLPRLDRILLIGWPGDAHLVSVSQQGSTLQHLKVSQPSCTHPIYCSFSNSHCLDLRVCQIAFSGSTLKQTMVSKLKVSVGLIESIAILSEASLFPRCILLQHCGEVLHCLTFQPLLPVCKHKSSALFTCICCSGKMKSLGAF